MTPPRAAASPAVFELVSTDIDEVDSAPTVFCINLPASTAGAQGALSTEEDRLSLLEIGLDGVAPRVESVIRMSGAGASAVSFGIDMPEPERGLLASLHAAQSGALSFSTEDGSSPEEQSRVKAFLDKLLGRLATFARVETRVSGKLAATTTVGWSGNFENVLGDDVTPADLKLHERSVAIALRTRRTWLRIILLTVQSATRLALAAGTGNLLLALPAAWKFIRGIMAEMKQLEPAA